MKNDKMRKSTSSCLGSHRGRCRHISMVAILLTIMWSVKKRKEDNEEDEEDEEGKKGCKGGGST